ncbi:MAG TPA: aminoacyl-tRNA hydrolase [Kofleriaceae bacterium]|nr:aminoacyl-tRNA hydrolase [Kofleriaceae bacterium]
MSERPTKQVIVMRKDLGMRKGKMIAQGAHAAMAVFTKDATISDNEMRCELTDAMKAWLGPTEGPRFAKICVSVDSEAALDDVVARARAAGLPCALITDSGKTEFHGIPTKTCCAVGPAWSDEIDAITGGLPLL